MHFFTDKFVIEKGALKVPSQQGKKHEEIIIRRGHKKQSAALFDLFQLAQYG